MVTLEQAIINWFTDTKEGRRTAKNILYNVVTMNELGKPIIDSYELNDSIGLFFSNCINEYNIAEALENIWEEEIKKEK